ncbi:Hypothetical protein NTJ_05003 [Nesidiocoris tenuis]|uniref:Uncharacterized protein n=1 Tax=Nesidiocoris tenuis TaxID=355587 RepID=A0ABN7AIV3_9HEMI|nr:Hypothetical protein NTJ_05003 [Nesidiocoris tenuis]
MKFPFPKASDLRTLTVEIALALSPLQSVILMWISRDRDAPAHVVVTTGEQGQSMRYKDEIGQSRSSDRCFSFCVKLARRFVSSSAAY